MKKYEYMILIVQDWGEIEYTLKTYGKDGWELVAVHDTRLYLKREIVNPNDIIGITSDGHYVIPYDTNKNS